MKLLLTLLLSCSLLCCLAQDNKKKESILYVVDSIPIIKDPDKDSGTLRNDDIDHLDVITNPDKIKAYGYSAIDKIIFITTKEFTKRPSEVRKIPSTKAMVQKGGLLYLKNASDPYSGKFIDYYLNGKIAGEGYLKDGIANGLHTVYYQNGKIDYYRNYINGIPNGDSEEYFPNGSLKQKGSFKDGKDDGLWTDYYSTGAIKRQTNFLNLIPQLSKQETKFYELQDKALQLMHAEDFKAAIKKLDDAEKLNAKYADLYFYRGTAKLDNFEFDSATLDFDKALELEPLYMEALANRAFSRIRKYQFKDSRTLSKNSEVTILAAKEKLEIPNDEKAKICSDLNKSIELGDDKESVIDALKTYCNN